MAENVNVSAGGAIPTTPGNAGLQTQVPGQSSTVSGLADASGGIAPGNLVETDIDEQLFRFQSEDTALMSLMLKAKKVKVLRLRYIFPERRQGNEKSSLCGHDLFECYDDICGSRDVTADRHSL